MDGQTNLAVHAAIHRQMFLRLVRPLARLTASVRTRRQLHAPVPLQLVDAVEVAGFEGVRFWGDHYSAAFERSVYEKDQQVRTAGEAGANARLERADFLALSGGGDNGAFAAGVLCGWSQRGDRPTFEVVTGVSAGALAAPYAFLGSDQDKALHALFTNFRPGFLFTPRGVRGFFSDAVNDTRPLADLIYQNADDAFLNRIGEEFAKGRRIFILTTNIEAQPPVIWDLTAIAAGRAIRQSSAGVAALPGMFPPVTIPVQTVDGQVSSKV